METAVAQWLTYCATNRKVTGSMPVGVIGIFHWHKILPITLWPWGQLSLWQKWVLGEFSGSKGGRCIRLTALLLSCAVMKSGNLNFLAPSGQLQACNGTDLPLHPSTSITVEVSCLLDSVSSGKQLLTCRRNPLSHLSRSVQSKSVSERHIPWRRRHQLPPKRRSCLTRPESSLALPQKPPISRPVHVLPCRNHKNSHIKTVKVIAPYGHTDRPSTAEDAVLLGCYPAAVTDRSHLQSGLYWVVIYFIPVS